MTWFIHAQYFFEIWLMSYGFEAFDFGPLQGKISRLNQVGSETFLIGRKYPTQENLWSELKAKHKFSHLEME